MERSESDEELTPNQIFDSWIRLSLMMMAAAGGNELDWDDLQEAAQAGLRDACAVCQKSVAEASGISYDDIARRSYLAYARVVQPQLVPEWVDVPEVERSCWRHLARHMANLLALEPDRDGGPERHEDQMLTRFVASLPKQGMTV